MNSENAKKAISTVASGIYRSIGGQFTKKEPKLKKVSGNEKLTKEEWKKYTSDFLNYVDQGKLNKSHIIANSTYGSLTGAPVTVDWIQLHNAMPGEKWDFETTEQMVELLPLKTIYGIYEDKDLSKNEDFPTLKAAVKPEGTWLKIDNDATKESNKNKYVELVGSYISITKGLLDEKEAQHTQMAIEDTEASEKAASEKGNTDLVQKLKFSAIWKKYGYLPDVMLTFDKDNQPTAYYYDFDPKNESTYESGLLKSIFHINSDNTIRPSQPDERNRIPLIYIKYGVKETYEDKPELAFYDLIWPTLLQQKIYNNTGEEMEKTVSVDNGMIIEKPHFKELEKVGKEKGFSITGSCGKYENFLGIDKNSNVVKPELCDRQSNQQISDQTDVYNVTAKRIIWNLACKASQVGWFGKWDHVFVGRLEDSIQADQTDQPSSGDNKSPESGNSGGSPETEAVDISKFLKAITYKPEMFKLWRDMDWNHSAKNLHDQTKKNAWTHALSEVWTGTVDRIYFGAYLGKVSESDTPRFSMPNNKGVDVFVTSDGLIKKLDDGTREHYLIEVDPASGGLGFKRNYGGFLFGGKRRRKSHRKSHKKTQKKHKKQMKKSHKKKTRGKKTRGKKC